MDSAKEDEGCRAVVTSCCVELCVDKTGVISMPYLKHFMRSQLYAHPPECLYASPHEWVVLELYWSWPKATEFPRGPTGLGKQQAAPGYVLSPPHPAALQLAVAMARAAVYSEGG